MDKPGQSYPEQTTEKPGQSRPSFQPWCMYTFDTCTGEWILDSPCSENEPHCPDPPRGARADTQSYSFRFKNRGDTVVELHNRSSRDSPTAVRIVIGGEVVMFVGALASGRFPLRVPVRSDDDECIQPGAVINCDNLK